VKKIERVHEFTKRLFNSYVDQANAAKTDEAREGHSLTAAALNAVIIMIESTYELDESELETEESDDEIRIGDRVRFTASRFDGTVYASGTGHVEEMHGDCFMVRQRYGYRGAGLTEDNLIVVTVNPHYAADSISKI
jgi:hypothetical protein